jgi:hypothetical protein
MNSLMEAVPLASAVGRGVILRRLFVIGYVAAGGVSIVG